MPDRRPAPATQGRRHLLHVFPSFGYGGVPIRISAVINHFGTRYRHTIVSLDGRCESGTRIDDRIQIKLVPFEVNKARIVATWSKFRRTIARTRPDLMLTYNWGATEWALVNSFFPICRHVHLESGFSIEEADGQLRRRVWFRRLALARARKIVVPSRTLVDLATRAWGFDPQMIAYIPNGVDCDKFAAAPKRGIIPGFEKRRGEIIIGTVAPLRPEKNLARLVRAFAAAAGRFDARLLIVGEGSERPKLEALARDIGVADRVVLAGHVDAVENVLGWMDAFAISSDTEQMPNSLLQAMAAGLPVAGIDVGDVKIIVAAENRPLVVAKQDAAAFERALERLLAEPERRTRVGAANRERARREYGQDRMFRAYEAVLEL